MSNNVNKKKAKKQKKVNAIKIVKNKKIVIGLCSLLFIIALAFIFHSVFRQKNIGISVDKETYSYHGQIIQLFSDGRFSASLAHNVIKNGTYTKLNENNRINVLFNVNGNIEIGWIINNSLYIPREWDDGHGHGNIFPKVN